MCRRIAGGSDGELVSAIVTEAPLCIACLAGRTGVPRQQVDTVLSRIGRTIKLSVRPGRCAGCLEDKMVFALHRARRPADAPPDPAPQPAPAPGAYRAALWSFLVDHRGAMFCSRCLATAIGATSRIDRALMDAEGRGGRRRYGRCSVCGRERLVCGA